MCCTRPASTTRVEPSRSAGVRRGTAADRRPKSRGRARGPAGRARGEGRNLRIFAATTRAEDFVVTDADSVSSNRERLQQISKLQAPPDSLTLSMCRSLTILTQTHSTGGTLLRPLSLLSHLTKNKNKRSSPRAIRVWLCRTQPPRRGPSLRRAAAASN